MASELTPAQRSGVAFATQELTRKGIMFYGPIRTPGGNTIFYLEQQIILESELADLSNAGCISKEGLSQFGQTVMMRTAGNKSNTLI